GVRLVRERLDLGALDLELVGERELGRLAHAQVHLQAELTAGLEQTHPIDRAGRAGHPDDQPLPPVPLRHAPQASHQCSRPHAPLMPAIRRFLQSRWPCSKSPARMLRAGPSGRRSGVYLPTRSAMLSKPRLCSRPDTSLMPTIRPCLQSATHPPPKARANAPS